MNPEKYVENYVQWKTGNGIDVELWLHDNFVAFAKKHHNLRSSTAAAITSALVERMSERGLHYHTPPHIVNILQSAKFLGIELEPWETMSIFFHDAIYVPGSPFGMNESCSAQFYQALMKPYVNKPDKSTDYNELLKVSTSITMTAQHCEALEGGNPMWHRVLDLDLLGFALPAGASDYVNNLVKMEFLDFGVKEEDYDKGRKVFLEKLISKGYIFRTEFFKNKFEDIAMENIKNGINGT